MTSEQRIDFLLRYVKDKPEIYNMVSNFLYQQFGLKSAELTMICTYVLCYYREVQNDH